MGSGSDENDFLIFQTVFLADGNELHPIAQWGSANY